MKCNQLPDVVVDELVQGILEASDEEILEEAKVEHKDVEAEVDRVRNLVESAINKSNKTNKRISENG